MSLLQFKPAPMYILDEIDAALDLSHTQNIGQLFRNRFKGSQFIVVSLKEGMFTNANVLFKSKFRDGVSAVDVIFSFHFDIVLKLCNRGSFKMGKELPASKLVISAWVHQAPLQ